MIKLAMIAVDAWIQRETKAGTIAMIMQVHDELVFELPKEHLQEAVNFIKNCMEERPFSAFDVPLVAEAAVGQTFGTLKDLED